MSEPVVVKREMPDNVPPSRERFWADAWFTEEFLAQYDVERLIEMGMVTDPDGKPATCIDEYCEIEREDTTVRFRFFGYAPREPTP